MAVDTIIPVQAQTDIASARREALAQARIAGLDENEAGALGIVVTEAASNLLKHGGGGDIITQVLQDGGDPVMRIIAMDRGKGIADISRGFEDGYSTAGSAGTGLGAIARLSRFHQVYSAPGQGTVVVAHVGKATRAAGFVDAAAISLPYPGEQVCGDAWVLRTSPGRCRLAVADGLGHGLFASQAANAAIEMVKVDGMAGTTAPMLEPAALMETIHSRLRATRGAAVAIADIDYSEGAVTFTGIGNIAGCVVQAFGSRRQMVAMNGTVGHEMRRVQTYRYPLPADSLVVLHSDGLTTHWSLEAYPGLQAYDLSVIAGVLMRDFRRTRDDATLVIVRAPDPNQ